MSTSEHEVRMCGGGEGIPYNEESNIEGIGIGEYVFGLGFDHFSVGNYDFAAIIGFLKV